MAIALLIAILLGPTLPSRPPMSVSATKSKERARTKRRRYLGPTAVGLWLARDGSRTDDAAEEVGLLPCAREKRLCCADGDVLSDMCDGSCIGVVVSGEYHGSHLELHRPEAGHSLTLGSEAASGDDREDSGLLPPGP